MPKIIFIESNGKEHDVKIAVGMTAMQAAVSRSVPGIDGDCGGSCSCSTCHVYVDKTWFEKTGSARGIEEDILDFAIDRGERSRLSCQIEMTMELDGLRLLIPERQH